MIGCDNCGGSFDPVGHRWLCPTCGFKASCCEGAMFVPPSPCGYCWDVVVSRDCPIHGEKEPSL